MQFTGLIMGFSSAALYYLGEQSLEGKAVEQVNLPLAKHNIDILALLEEKTKGNLEDVEAKLLREVLAELRMKYVKAVR
jgi:hypothetical protein